MKRCDWCLGDADYMQYHDEEWGVPTYDPIKLFEFLLLEGAQAGLSWLTVLRKRTNYRNALDDFEPGLIAAYDETKQAELMANPGIIRNRLKIASAIRNARAYLELEASTSGFSDFVWSFVDGRPIQHAWHNLSEVPPSTRESDAMSSALKKRGFNFVGSTICYAFMQATGMVNDHLVDCHRYQDCMLLGDR